MNESEQKKLLDIYEMLISGRIQQARYMLAKFLDINEPTSDPEAA